MSAATRQLRYVRPHPGPMPPPWRFIARGRWRGAMREHVAAARSNWRAIHGPLPPDFNLTGHGSDGEGQ